MKIFFETFGKPEDPRMECRKLKEHSHYVTNERNHLTEDSDLNDFKTK